MSEPQVETPEEPEADTPEPDAPEEPTAETPEPGTLEPDDEQDDEPEEEPEEPEKDEDGATLRSQAEIEAAAKKVDGLRAHVARRIGEIFQDDAGFLIGCPMCANTAPGWLWPPEHAPMDDEQTRAIFTTLGVIKPEEFAHHQTLDQCPDCNGLGKVVTGSRVPGFDVVDCPRCLGKGWAQVKPNVVYANGSGEPQADPTMTGPTVTAAPDDPAVQALKDRGFLVVPPPNFNAPV